jgi:hypothetical protein
LIWLFLNSCAEVSPLATPRLGFKNRPKRRVSNWLKLALNQFSKATTGAVASPITLGNWPSGVRNVVSMPHDARLRAYGQRGKARPGHCFVTQQERLVEEVQGAARAFQPTSATCPPRCRSP